MKILSNKSKYFLHFDLEYGIIISVVKIIEYAPIAQLDRVFGYEPKDRGFESLWAYQVAANYAAFKNPSIWLGFSHMLRCCSSFVKKHVRIG